MLLRALKFVVLPAALLIACQGDNLPEEPDDFSGVSTSRSVKRDDDATAKPKEEKKSEVFDPNSPDPSGINVQQGTQILDPNQPNTAAAGGGGLFPGGGGAVPNPALRWLTGGANGLTGSSNISISNGGFNQTITNTAGGGNTRASATVGPNGPRACSTVNGREICAGD